jgi:hypothetical protein
LAGCGHVRPVFSSGQTAEHVQTCSPIGGIGGAAQLSAVEPPTCGWARVADFTKNANATLNLVQLLISGTTCRPKLLASDDFSTTTPSARRAGPVAISALSRLPGQHLL